MKDNKVEYIYTYDLGRTISRKLCEGCGVKVRYFAGYWLDVITDVTSKPCRTWPNGEFLCHACSLNKLGTGKYNNFDVENLKKESAETIRRIKNIQKSINKLM